VGSREPGNEARGKETPRVAKGDKTRPTVHLNLAREKNYDCQHRGVTKKNTLQKGIRVMLVKGRRMPFYGGLLSRANSVFCRKVEGNFG